MKKKEIEVRNVSNEILFGEGWLNENGDFVSYVRGNNEETYFLRNGVWYVRNY